MMTYASQLRSSNKPMTLGNNKEEYDLNSLSIICKYFVGSLVEVKTNEGIIEGVLHTLYQNQICLSLVTTSDVNKPEKILTMNQNKIINLSEVLCISTSKENSQCDVAIKDRFIKLPPSHASGQLQDDNNNVTINTGGGGDTKPVSKTISINYANVIKSNCELAKSSPVKPASVNNSVTTTAKSTATNNHYKSELEKENISDKPQLDKRPPQKESSPAQDSSSGSSCSTANTKKSFAFNPNAPEFKPRSVSSSESSSTATTCQQGSTMIFPPPSLHSPPPLGSSAATSALFVPNYILIDSRQLSAVAVAVPNTNVADNPQTAASAANPHEQPPQPYYSPISFFVPNSSIVQLPSPHAQQQKPVNSVSESSDDGGSCNKSTSNFAATGSHYNRRPNRAQTAPRQPPTQNVPATNPETLLANPSNWPPLPEPTKPHHTSRLED